VSTEYRVYITPLYSAFTYGTEVEVSEWVKNVSGTITKSIDSQDFTVGVYTFNDVELTVDNAEGKFSDPQDTRSIFRYSRNLAKVRIVYDRGDGSPSISYRGVINDDATAIDSDSDEATFTILGPDSVFKTATVPAGTITAGMTILNALVAVLNTSDVRSTLNVQLTNINPQNNVAIDDGTKFDGLNKRDAIATLLGASNSVMIIDADSNVIVRDRIQNYGNPTVYLYGKGDLLGRENIISIQNYNTGLQRLFNSVFVVGGTPTVEVTDISSTTQTVAQKALTGKSNVAASQAIYGVRQKKFNFEWLTEQSTLDDVASGITDEFAYAKIELEVKVPTELVATAELLDQVSVSYPLLLTPTGKFLPVIGVTKIGDADSPLPNVKGSISIDESLGFKIIEKTEELTDFTTTLKLRQVGKTQYDGVLTVPIATKTVAFADSPFQMTPDYDLYLVDASGGAVTLTLPSPIKQPQKNYTVEKVDSSINAVTVQRYASDYIKSKFGAATTFTMRNLSDSADFGTNLTDWYVLQTNVGASGASALVWRVMSNAPTEADFASVEVFAFDYQSVQEIWGGLTVPASYALGAQIKLVGGKFATPATTGKVKFKCSTYLERAGSSVAGTLGTAHDSVNVEVSAPATPSQWTAIGDIDLTDSSGQVNGVAVAAGDKLTIKLIRDTGNESVSAAADGNFDRWAMGPQFG
jgi:hypothetical protein